MTAGKLYRTIEVWRRQDNQAAIRYVCLEDMDTQCFWVKSADFVRYPLDKPAIAALDLQRVEIVLDSLIFEDEEDLRIWRPSIQQAVDAFDRDFENS